MTLAASGGVGGGVHFFSPLRHLLVARHYYRHIEKVNNLKQAGKFGNCFGSESECISLFPYMAMFCVVPVRTLLCHALR